MPRPGIRMIAAGTRPQGAVSRSPSDQALTRRGLARSTTTSLRPFDAGPLPVCSQPSVALIRCRRSLVDAAFPARLEERGGLEKSSAAGHGWPAEWASTRSRRSAQLSARAVAPENQRIPGINDRSVAASHPQTERRAEFTAAKGRNRLDRSLLLGSSSSSSDDAASREQFRPRSSQRRHCWSHERAALSRRLWRGRGASARGQKQLRTHRAPMCLLCPGTSRPASRPQRSRCPCAGPMTRTPTTASSPFRSPASASR
jgi:hypothetical protein